MKEQQESKIAQAWYTAAFSGQKKLKPLDYYIRNKIETKSVSIEEAKKIDKYLTENKIILRECSEQEFELLYNSGKR